MHCWKDKREWALETFGEHSDEHLATHMDGGNATCLLEDGHEGPHEWTADGDIVVSFAASDTKTHNEKG